MKKILYSLLCIALFQTATAEAPKPSISDQVRLRIAQSTLQNFAAALEMWREDHDGHYPDSLEVLVPNYLRHMPPGPYGSASDWQYIVRSDRSAYQVQVHGRPFGNFGLPAAAPSYDSTLGLLPVSKIELPSMKYDLEIPAAQAADWQLEHGYYQRDGEHFMGVSLSGPVALSQDGSAWVNYAVDEYKGRFGAVVESEKPFAMGELFGVELMGSWNGSRYHAFYATDGKAGWVFEYSGNADPSSAEYDAMFVEMVKNRKRGIAP
jgi:hypothetical protein